MGKPKLVTSIKAVQEALFNLRATGPKSMTWVCVHQAKTESFREVCNSFNSMYSQLACSEDQADQVEDIRDRGNGSEDEEAATVGGDDHIVSISRLSEVGESFSSSSLASSSLWTESYDSSQTELVTKGSISSKRFFFSPCSTKSIMAEEVVFQQPAAEAVNKQVVLEDDRDGIVRSSSLAEDEDEDDDDEDSSHVLRRESVMMAVASENPYQDFRDSMEEMVEAHGIKDWSGLHDLLHCYLTLNEKSNHETILLAFVDLLIKLVASQETQLLNITTNTVLRL